MNIKKGDLVFVEGHAMTFIVLEVSKDGTTCVVRLFSQTEQTTIPVAPNLPLPEPGDLRVSCSTLRPAKRAR